MDKHCTGQYPIKKFNRNLALSYSKDERLCKEDGELTTIISVAWLLIKTSIAKQLLKLSRPLAC